METQDYLTELFKRLSNTMNRTIEDMLPYIEALRNNWFDTADTLRGLTDEQYQKMNIPLRLVEAIRTYLTISKPEQVQSIEPKGNLSYQQLTKLVDELNLNLRAQFRYDAPTLHRTIDTLNKVIKNIVAEPYYQKYRCLKKNNKVIEQLILANPICLNFLKNIGFVDYYAALMFNSKDVHELYYVDDLIERILKKNTYGTGPKSEQKPKEESRFLQITEFPAGNGVQMEVSPDQLEEANYHDLLDRLLAYREKLMSTPPQNRKARIYHQKYEVKEDKFAELDIEAAFYVSDDQIIRQNWAQVLEKKKKGAHFQSKRKLEFEYLMKQKVYKETLIKIKLPNNLLIYGYFGPLEKLSSVFEFVCDIVVGELYIYTTPPVRRYDKEMERTLYDLDSVPTGQFYLGIKSEWYIKKEYADKLNA